MYHIQESIKNAVITLEKELVKLNDVSYDSIDKLMKNIMKTHNLTAKELHNAFIDKNKKTPDDWIKEKLNEGTLHHWFKGSRSKSGKPGWVQADGSPCANEPGETKTPKCFSSARLKALKAKGKKGKALIASAVRRKRQKDKGQQSKRGGASPTYVPTFAKGKKNPNYIKAEPGIKEAMELKEEQKDKPGKGSGTKDACYHKVKSRYSVFPSAYASGALVKCRKVGAKNWGTKTEEIEMIRYCPKCKKDETRSECRYGPKYWDMFSIPSTLTPNQMKYDPNRPHPANESKEPDHEHSMARSELSTIISAAKRLRKKVKGEGNLEAWVQSKITKAADYIDTAADYVDSGEMEEQVKPVNSDFDRFSRRVNAIKATTNPQTKIKILKSAANLYPKNVNEQQVGGSVKIKSGKGLGGGVLSYPEGKAPKKHGENEPKLPRLQQAHYEPEGEVIDEKCWTGYKKKGMKTMFGKRYPNCIKAEEFSNWREDFGLSEDWQKVNRQDKTDGLSQKAVNAYRRENPGSKLQTAVTEKNPEGKRAKRRKNFCSRMKGMRSKLTSTKTARDPDSRINKALRRWNCN